MEVFTQDLPHNITLIDTEYGRRGCAASYLLQDSGRAAFIETGAGAAAPRLMAVLEQKGIPPEAVDFVIVTHIHLDHAGAAGRLLRDLPNARLAVHPLGARHMADPERLVASTIAVYGEEAFRTLHGEIPPIPVHRILEMADGSTLTLGSRTLTFLYSPGHARHHHCIWDETSRGLFTGDTLGIAYPELAGPLGPFVYPATTPTQFDPAALHLSLDRLAALQPEWLYFTHFGPLRFERTLVGELHRLVDRISILAQGTRKAGAEQKSRLVDGMRKVFMGRLAKVGCPLNAQQVNELLAMDLDLNAQGLIHWVERLEKGPRPQR
ncbi:MAG: MBL fold metallo-hydrolase [Magnetococcus sp. WYHC-3]